jgi:hypothetical protein
MNGGRIAAFGLHGELEAHGERDEVLVDAVVKLALDRPALGIRGQGKPSPGRAEIFRLGTQPVELLLCLWPSLQGDRLPS